MTAGNREYWYCGDCGKYFANAQFTAETSLAAVTLELADHTYGDWQAETPASHTVDGVVAHKDCTVCKKHFTEENVEIAEANLVIKAGHQFSQEFTVDSEATCTAKGSRSKHCTVEGCTEKTGVEEIAINENNHTYGSLVAEVVPVDCSMSGTIAHYHCDCGLYFDANKQLLLFGAAQLNYPAPASLHDLEHCEAQAASCTDYGWEESWDCSLCWRSFADAEATVEIMVILDDPLGHNFGNLIEGKAATCSETGVMAHYHCDRCNNYFADNLDELSTDYLSAADLIIEADPENHAFGELIPAMPSVSCKFSGTIAYYQCGCGLYFDENKNLLANGAADLIAAPDPSLHQFTHRAAQTVSCVDNGWGESWDCSECGRSFADEQATQEIFVSMIEDPLGHSFGSLIESRDATCAREGVLSHYHCDRCGKDFANNSDEFSTEYIDATVAVDPENHTYGELIDEVVPVSCTDLGAVAHYHCDCGLYFDANKNVLGADDLVIEPAASLHELVHTAAQAVSCVEGGWGESWDCSVCGRSFADEQATAEIVKNVEAPVGHIISFVGKTAATCVKEGEIAHYHCERCGFDFTDDAQFTTEYIFDLVIPADPANHAYELVHCAAQTVSCVDYGWGESWDCPACIRSFADAEGTEEINKAVEAPFGHSFEFVEGTAATCAEEGIAAHYHCDVCGKDFEDDDNWFSTDYLESCAIAVDPDNHVSGLEYSAGQPASCTESGLKESWKCTDCGKLYADAQATEEISAPVVIPASGHNFVFVQIQAATCAEAGVKAHHHCDVCGKDFSNNYNDYSTKYLTADELSIPVNADAHAYPDSYTYNYGEKQYEKVCGNDQTHVIPQPAGSEDYPYLANSEETLKGAVALGGYVQVVEDITLTGSVAVDKEVKINLGKKTVSAQGVNAFELSGNAALEVTDGNANADGRVFNMSGAATLTLNGVNVGGKSQGIVSTASGAININGGEITTASFPVYVIPGSLAYNYDANPVYVPQVNVTDTTVSTTANVGFWVVATELNMTRCNVTINSKNKASACVFTLGGTVATLNQCTLTNLVGSALMGNGSLIGSNNAGEHVYITLNDCTVTGGECALYLPQSNGKTTVKGGSYTANATDPATTKSAVEIRGGELVIDGAELTCIREDFKRVPNNNGSTVYGAALAVSQHNTNQNVSVEVKNSKLSGHYAVYEWDQDTKDSNKISVNLGQYNELMGCIYSENCANLAAIAASSHYYSDGVCVCGDSATLVATAQEFVEAFEKGGKIRLLNNLDLTSTEADETTYYVTLNDTVLDLNGCTITTKRGLKAGKKGDSTVTPVFTVVNGRINRALIERNPNTNIAALSAVGYGELRVVNCTVTTNHDTAVSIFDFAKVKVFDSTLKGVYYALGSNAGAGNYSDALYVEVRNSTLDAQYTGLLWNVPGKMIVDNCSISGIGQALIVRGGTATVSNTTLTKRAGVEGVDDERAICGDTGYVAKEGEPSWYTFNYYTYEYSAWGSGNLVPGYALVVGNRSNSYQYATDLTLINVQIAVEDVMEADKCVYAFGNTNKSEGAPAYGATVTYDGKCELGNIVLGDEFTEGSSTVIINAL